MKIVDHRLLAATQLPSPHYDQRPDDEISLIIIHGISLPAGHFGGDYIAHLFAGDLDCSAHQDFADLVQVRVSSHLLIRRDGRLQQFVPFNLRAWHAGVSSYAGRQACNDFAIGIELEGTDTSGYRDIQYTQLARVVNCLQECYDIPPEAVCGHADVAPGRKTDPGPAFDWSGFRKRLMNV